MRLKADLALLLVSIIWGTAFVAQRVAGQMGSVYLFNGTRYLLAALQALGCVLIFIAVILSQFKELNLRGKIEHPNLMEDR